MSIEIKPSTYLNFRAFVKASRDIYPLNSVDAIFYQWLFYLKTIKHKGLIEAFSEEINQLGYGHILKLEPNV